MNNDSLWMLRLTCMWEAIWDAGHMCAFKTCPFTIQRRKKLATIALAKNDTIWKKNWKPKLITRIWLYQMLVKSVLLYNCRIWGVSKDDQGKLNSFWRKLRKMIGIQWLQKISIIKLYKITGTMPLLITITERRWKLLKKTLWPPFVDGVQLPQG